MSWIEWLAAALVLINVALAVFNLMPIPVLDGGHVVFATIAKLRGRPIPPNIIASVQTFFFILLILLMLYVSTNDVRRAVRDTHPASEEKQPEKTPAPQPSATDPAPAPAPAPADAPPAPLLPPAN